MSPKESAKFSEVYEWIAHAHRARLESILRDRADVLSNEMVNIASGVSDRLRKLVDNLANEVLLRTGHDLRRVADDNLAADLRRLAADDLEADATTLERELHPERSVPSEAPGAIRGVEEFRAQLPETFGEDAEISGRELETLGETDAPPLPDDPRELNEVWSTLSTYDKATIWQSDPFVGNRDGIPHVERDVFNRLNLDRLLGDARRDNDVDAFFNYSKIDRAIGNEGDYFLTYLDKDFQTAVSDKDTDFAQYKVTYVVGAGTKPIDTPAITDKLSQAAMQQDENANVATTRWQAFKRPSGRQINDPSYADNAAPILRRYQKGLLATHQGDAEPVMTIVGQSYGGLVVGESARAGAEAELETGLHATYVAFTGSFAGSVDNVSEFKLAGIDSAENKEHVFATMKKHDPFDKMPTVRGRKPASPEFGATVFTSPSERGSWKTLFMNAEEHGSYYYDDWDSANPTLTNLGLIITGQGHLVT